MNYALNDQAAPNKEGASLSAYKSLLPLLRGEGRTLNFAAVATLLNSLLNLSAPLLIAHIVDRYISTKSVDGMLPWVLLLLSLYLAGPFTSFGQTRLMGGVGQRVMYNLRARIFSKLQDLPVAFFHANKTGDLISRINNDTDKLNIFFSQTLVQFMGSLVIMVGAAIFLLVIHWQLGVAALAPAAVLLVFTQMLSPWVKAKNRESLETMGGISAEVSESLQNFRVIVAFNRRDFFMQRFTDANDKNYRKALWAGIASSLFMPIFSLSSHVAQLLVLLFGIYLVSTGATTIGILISYFAYVQTFYNPLRQLAALWSNLQVALAGWERIDAVLQMQSNMNEPSANTAASAAAPLLQFQQVSFAYNANTPVLSKLDLTLERGKTYALIGPTGGGKTTTASLMARLFDPTAGHVFLEGRDIRNVSASERAQKIGFILQDPILFTGTLRDNIVYGNANYAALSDEALLTILTDTGLNELLSRFDGGLQAPIATTGDAISLGQKQLIAFMRAVLRNPDLLILDEATANIDTVTEQLLEKILHKLPASTTRVIIAHRLNTIENADEIFFVNGASVSKASSMQNAMSMLLSPT